MRRLASELNYQDKIAAQLTSAELKDTLRIVAIKSNQEESKPRDPMAEVSYGNTKNFS